jgi:DNA-binding NarL/FixJ family response regulator
VAEHDSPRHDGSRRDGEADITVLLVDDQVRFRSAARHVIERTEGFVLVAESGDGIDAVEQADATQPQLILMDIHLPGIDGIEATRRILASHPHVVVVLISSYAREDLPDSAMRSGAIAYLNKEELDPAALREVWTAHAPRA